MRVCHGVTAVFDDRNLVSYGGLAPVLALAERAGLHRLVGEHVTIGANAAPKIASLVAGMVAGADCIDDMAVLRHGATDRLFIGVRAPSTLGTFLRGFTFGHVRQLDAVASRLLIGLTRRAPLVVDADRLAYVDVDDTVRQTYGAAKQGAGRGYTGIYGLNALLGTVTTAGSAPLIVATRLRKGSSASARGAARLVTDALAVAASAGATGVRVLRADAAFYNHNVIAACRSSGSRFSITVRTNSAIRATIASIDPDAWTPIKYTNAVFDEAAQQWISDAEVAEVPYTAFAKQAKPQRVTARLIVRRIPDLNPAHQCELFTVYRYHAVFTDSPLPMLQAEAAHRGHAVIEQVIADLKNGPLAHLPSGRFNANAAWLACAAIAFNLTRAAGALASKIHANATTSTIRRQLIAVPARLARSARQLTLHLPINWPSTAAWQRLHTAANAPPPTATT
jgi:Transposase DDE domain group 1